MGLQDGVSTVSREALLSVIGRRLGVVKPTPDSSKALGYTYKPAEELMGVETEKLQAMLDEAASKGYLEKSPAFKISICPSCGSGMLSLVERCPSCNMLGVALRDESGRCISCNKPIEAAETLVSCRSCGELSQPGQVGLRQTYTYSLKEDVKELARGVEVWVEILESLREISQKLDIIQGLLMGKHETARGVPQAPRAELNERLLKTYEAVLRRWSTTSDEVASETGRSRALESMYLNQLVALGLVQRERIGKKVFFTPSGGLGVLTSQLRPVMEELVRRGWAVEAPAVISGKSGASHTFTLAVMSGEGVPKLVATIILSNRPAEDGQVISFLAKAMDVDAEAMLFAAMPSVGESAKKLANLYGIRVLDIPSHEAITQLVSESILAVLH
ncbi:MAG: hypothetical protein QXI97_00860 [Nitrososphaerota archaeon]